MHKMHKKYKLMQNVLLMLTKKILCDSIGLQKCFIYEQMILKFTFDGMKVSNACD